MVTQWTSDAAKKVAAFKAKKAAQAATTTQASNPQPVSEITPTQAHSTAPTTPTKASDSQSKAWNAMDLKKQQEFVSKNTGFDPTKYWLSYKSASTTTLPEETTVPEEKTAPTEWVKLAVWPEPSTKTPDYANKETARLQEIRDNLSQYYQSQQDLFKDRSRFDTFFKYNDRVQEQKQVLDDFFKQKERERLLAWKSATDLAKSGDDVDFLKDTDPNFYNEIQQEKNNLNQQTTNTNTLLTLAKQFWFTDIDENNILDQFEENAALKRPSLTDTPEIAAVKTDLTDTYTKIEQLDLEMDRIRKEVISQYPGVPESQISAIITDRTNKLLDQKNSLLKDANNAEWHIKNYQDNQSLQQQDFELAQKDIQWKIANFSSMYWLYQETPEGIAEKAMAEYKAANPNMDTGTPDQVEEAINQTLAGYYKDYADIIQRPQAQVLREVQDYAKAKGIPVSQALKENFLTPLMAKPEFKQMQDKALGLTDKRQKLSDTVLYNATTGEFKTVTAGTTTWGTGWYSWPDYTAIDSWTLQSGLTNLLSNPLFDNKNAQCWEWVNDWLQFMWVSNANIFTDPIEVKIAATNSQDAKVGSVAVFDWWTKHWHVWVVTKVDSNGTPTEITDWNRNKDGKKTTHAITAAQAAKIKWYFDPTLAKSTTSSADTMNITGSYDKLTADQKLQAEQIAIWIWWKKAALKQEQKDLVASQMLAGKSMADIAGELSDYDATKKYVATLNNPQQVRLKQAVNFTQESLWLVDALNAEAETALSKSGITELAKVQKKAALNGLLWQEVKNVFTRLNNQVADLRWELAVVYQGGNTPTDKALENAMQMLDTNRDYQTLKDNIELVKKNLALRVKSLNAIWISTINNPSWSTSDDIYWW